MIYKKSLIQMMNSKMISILKKIIYIIIYYNMLIYLITPSLGLLRNYVKYKQIKYLLYVRTPITYLILYIIFQTNNIWKILILERWFFLLYKTILSIYNKDYYRKRIKYEKSKTSEQPKLSIR